MSPATVTTAVIDTSLNTGSRTLTLTGALYVQRGVRILMTATPAAALLERTKVDVLEDHGGSSTGYQRLPSPTRMGQAATFYKQGGLMPNPLLGNIRDTDFHFVRVDIIDGDEAAYIEAVREKGNWIGLAQIFIPAHVPFYIFDGQHREGGIKRLLREDFETFAPFPVPISLSLGLSMGDELEEFYQVNSNAKSVSTQIAYALLRERVRNNPDLADSLIGSGRGWQPRALAVVGALVKMNSVWREQIQLGNQTKSRKDRLTVTQQQFVDSLKPIVEMPAFRGMETTQIATIVNAYWQGIERVLPQAFEPNESPKNWVLFKGAGVIVMHAVLPQVAEVLRGRGQRLGDPTAWADVLRGLQSLSGLTIDPVTGQEQMVTGVDFWRAGDGVAGAYSGQAGHKRLTAFVARVLPQPASELNI